MSLAPGTRLGPYEVLSPLGAGGMGEVYRARDTRLDRDVAIKVLPAEFAQDADRLARFEREAKAIAALSHPNILALYDIGSHGGQTYVVTEVLDGETLRDRVNAGALPVRKAIDYAVQIARGLAAAHDKGLVHRDLKPGNLFLLTDGQVKILDFGLAKTMTAGSGATETVAAVTGAGTVLGTVGYMAPEQVRGQAMDARTDLFAYGAVLYEMLSGHRAFQRDTAADTMTAILLEDPPELGGTRPDLSPALDRIVRHCVEKNPNERFQTARDVAFALEAFSGSVTSGAAIAAAAPSRPWRRWGASAIGAVVLVTAGIAIDRLVVGTPPAPPAITFTDATFDAEWITNARFAAGGQTIVFSAALTGNTPDLYVIRPGAVAPQPVGPPHTHLLSVSSKDELAVLTDAHFIHQRLFSGTLARMTLDSAPRPLLEDVREADWSPDGLKLAIIHTVGNTDQLEYPVGTLLHQTRGYLSDVRVSRDGAHVAFFEHAIRFDDRGWVKVVDSSGHVVTLTKEYGGLEGLAWSVDSRSVLFSGDLFFPRIVNISGTPEVRRAFPSESEHFVYDVAGDGRVLVARNDRRSSIRALLPGESAEREFAWLDSANGGVLSRDGRVLLFFDDYHTSSANSDYGIYLRKTDGSPAFLLGEGLANDLSPDARWALARIPSKQQLVLYPTGPGERVDIDLGPIEHYLNSRWFPDGRRFLICGSEASRPPRCYEQPMAGGPPVPITPDDVVQAWIARDSRTLLLRTTSGAKGIFVIGGRAAQPAAGLLADDTVITWSQDGRSVFVQAHSGLGGPARVERVDITTGARAFVRELAPPDQSGTVSVYVQQWIDDGKGYVYRYVRQLSKLFVVSGVK
jgi:hypothetical protein